MSAEDERRKNRQARKKRQMTGAVAAIIFVVICLIAAAVVVWKVVPFSEKEKGTESGLSTTEMGSIGETAVQTEAVTETETETEPPMSISVKAEDLHSKNAILIRVKTGQAVLDKNGEERIYPASMTKIMTAVLVLEKISDLQEKVRLSENMFDRLYIEEASMAGFSPGEEVSALDLLYGVMLPSGAECCTGLAEYIAGSEEAFAELMNKKAAELGMDGTHFMNASGLHDENHYTTAADLAKLLEYALKNDVFREIVTSAVHSTEGTDLHPDGITFYSTLFGNMTEEIHTSGLIKGGKTGYTEQAGLCLASFGEVNGEEFILITAGADGNHETEQFHITDAYQIYKNIGSNF